MNKYNLIAICGKSASGKDTLLNEILKQDIENKYQKQISHTSRPMREGEEDGVDYYFVDDKYFIENEKDFLEHLKFNDWHYGASTKSLSKDKINIGIFTPGGINILLNERDRINLKVVYVDVDAPIRIYRAIKREKDVNIEEINRRYYADEEDFKNIYRYRDILKEDFIALDGNEGMEQVSKHARYIINNIKF